MLLLGKIEENMTTENFSFFNAAADEENDTNKEDVGSPFKILNTVYV